MNPTMVDIFSDDAFGLTSFTKALDKIPYKPQLLGQLGLFTPDPIDTVTFAIESREGALSIIKSSPRGAPLEQLAPESRDVRDFRTIRLAKGDKIMASELLGRREFGSSVDMERVMTRVMRATTRLRNDMEMTWERHRLGALQGIVLDANDSPLYNWFTAWGVAQPAEINFDLANADTDLRKTCRDVKRTMQRNAEGAWVPGTSVGALVGDNFYDALVNHKVFKEAKLGTDRAPLLENIEGFSSVEFEGITFINYRGTDDGTTLSIGTDNF